MKSKIKTEKIDKQQLKLLLEDLEILKDMVTNKDHQIKQLEEDYKDLKQENARLKEENELHYKQIVRYRKYADKNRLDMCLLEKEIQRLRQALEEIKNLGEYSCGFIDSTDNLCNRIPKDEIIKIIDKALGDK